MVDSFSTASAVIGHGAQQAASHHGMNEVSYRYHTAMLQHFATVRMPRPPQSGSRYEYFAVFQASYMRRFARMNGVVSLKPMSYHVYRFIHFCSLQRM